MDQIVLVDARCDSVTISWMKAEEAVCYILEYRTVNPLEPDWQLLAEDIQGTSSRKRNLMPESQYFFRVSPVYEDDTVGPWLTHDDVFETISQEQDEDYAMAAPIVTIPVEPNALIITWEEVDEDVHGFEMQMRENRGGARWVSFQVSSHSAEVKKKNLTSPWGYQFRVRPVTDFDEPFSPPSNPVQPRRGEKYNRQSKTYGNQASTARQQEERHNYEEQAEYYDEYDTAQRQYGEYSEYSMPAPWFKAAGEGSVLVCWQAQQGATGYELQMKEILPGYSQEEGWETIAARLSGTTVRKKNLVSANGYQFRVRPVDGPMANGGFSNHSNPVVLPQSSKSRQARQTRSDKLSEDAVYSMPAPWFKGANERHSIIVCWQDQGPRVSSYSLQMKECAQGEQWQTIASGLTRTEVKKKNLPSANGYRFRVKPMDGPNAHKEYSKASSIAIAH